MGEKTTAKVTVLLTPADKAKIEEIAFEDGRKVSDFVRRALKELIAEHEQRLAQGGRNCGTCNNTGQVQVGDSEHVVSCPEPFCQW